MGDRIKLEVWGVETFLAEESHNSPVGSEETNSREVPLASVTAEILLSRSAGYFGICALFGIDMQDFFPSKFPSD